MLFPRFSFGVPEYQWSYTTSLVGLTSHIVDYWTKFGTELAVYQLTSNAVNQARLLIGLLYWFTAVGYASSAFAGVYRGGSVDVLGVFGLAYAYGALTAVACGAAAWSLCRAYILQALVHIFLSWALKVMGVRVTFDTIEQVRRLLDNLSYVILIRNQMEIDAEFRKKHKLTEDEEEKLRAERQEVINHIDQKELQAGRKPRHVQRFAADMVGFALASLTILVAVVQYDPTVDSLLKTLTLIYAAGSRFFGGELAELSQVVSALGGFSLLAKFFAYDQIMIVVRLIAGSSWYMYIGDMCSRFADRLGFVDERRRAFAQKARVAFGLSAAGAVAGLGAYSMVQYTYNTKHITDPVCDMPESDREAIALAKAYAASASVEMQPLSASAAATAPVQTPAPAPAPKLRSAATEPDEWDVTGGMSDADFRTLIGLQRAVKATRAHRIIQARKRITAKNGDTVLKKVFIYDDEEGHRLRWQNALGEWEQAEYDPGQKNQVLSYHFDAWDEEDDFVANMSRVDDDRADFGGYARGKQTFEKQAAVATSTVAEKPKAKVKETDRADELVDIALEGKTTPQLVELRRALKSLRHKLCKQAKTEDWPAEKLGSWTELVKATVAATEAPESNGAAIAAALKKLGASEDSTAEIMRLVCGTLEAARLISMKDITTCSVRHVTDKHTMQVVGVILKGKVRFPAHVAEGKIWPAAASLTAHKFEMSFDEQTWHELPKAQLCSLDTVEANLPGNLSGVTSTKLAIASMDFTPAVGAPLIVLGRRNGGDVLTAGVYEGKSIMTQGDWGSVSLGKYRVDSANGDCGSLVLAEDNDRWVILGRHMYAVGTTKMFLFEAHVEVLKRVRGDALLKAIAANSEQSNSRAAKTQPAPKAGSKTSVQPQAALPGGKAAHTPAKSPSTSEGKAPASTSTA